MMTMDMLKHMIYLRYVSWIDWFLTRTVNLYKNRTRTIYSNGTKYLQRTYLKKNGIFPAIFIHRFYASDQDFFPHDHPFEKSWSLILCGSYREIKVVPNKNWFDTVYKPGMINVISNKEYHKITMLSNPIWTLFFAKKSSKDWGFYDKETGEHIPWQEYTARNNNYILDMDGNPSTLLDE